VLPLLIFNEHKQVLTDTRYLKHLEIMNKDPLADRYFNIIKNKIKDEQTYMEIISPKHDKRRSSRNIIR